MGNKAAYDLWWKTRSSTAWTSSCSPTATATAIRARKELPELGWGTWQVPDTDHPAVLAHRCDWQGRGMLVLHNLGPEPVEVGVALGDDVEPGRPMAELLGNRHQEPAITGQPMALAGFGYRWLRLPG